MVRWIHFQTTWQKEPFVWEGALHFHGLCPGKRGPWMGSSKLHTVYSKNELTREGTTANNLCMWTMFRCPINSFICPYTIAKSSLVSTYLLTGQTTVVLSSTQKSGLLLDFQGGRGSMLSLILNVNGLPFLSKKNTNFLGAVHDENRAFILRNNTWNRKA